MDRSDIDIAILCPQATSMQWHKILECIDNADTLLKIDCVRLDTLSQHSALRKSILSQGVCLYQKRDV